jgi:hypothetical protein
MKAKTPTAKKTMPAYKVGGVKKAAPKYKASGAKKSLRRYQDTGVVNSNSTTTGTAPVITAPAAPAAPLSLEQQRFNAEQAAIASKASDIKTYENMLLTGNRRQRNYAKDKLTISGAITDKKKRDGSTLATITGSLLGGFGAVAPYLFKKKDQPEEKMGGAIMKKGGVAKKTIKKFQSAGEYSTKAPAPQSATRNGKTFTKGTDGTYTVKPVTAVKRKGGPARKK